MKNKNEKSKKPFFLKKYLRPVEEISEVEEDDNVLEVFVEKNVGFNTVEVIIIILVSVFFGAVVGCVLSSSRTFGVKVSSEVQEIINTYESIVDNYYGEIDEKELLNSAVSGMISTLDDPYSLFMNSEVAEGFNETVDGSFVGIGVTVEWNEKDFCIIDVLKDSPAEKAKLQVGDILTKIDGESISGLSLEELSSKIKGKVGTNVSITVNRQEKEITVKVKRAVVEVPSVSSRILEGKIGYIFIESFAGNTSNQFSKQLEDLEKQNITSLIIDVRANPGGKLGQVNNILDLFFDKKTVLYKIETKGKTENIYAKKSNSRDYPVVVLVNHGSASAAEILAASFQDNYDNASVVGVITYGKGTIQKAIDLSSGASIKYTTQRWLTPKGKWIDEIGVIPDLLIDQSEAYEVEPNDDNDVQLKKAIEILKK